MLVSSRDYAMPSVCRLHFSICACHPCAGGMLIFPVSFLFFTDDPRRESTWRAAAKSGRDPKFKEAFTIRFWQPLSLQHSLPFIGTSEDVHVEVGVGVGASTHPPPALHLVGLTCCPTPAQCPMRAPWPKIPWMEKDCFGITQFHGMQPLQCVCAFRNS